MKQTQKAWRNRAKAGQTITIRALERSIDAEGFLPDLEADEVAKIAKMPGWSLVDRNGAEIVAGKIDDIRRDRARLMKERDVLLVQIQGVDKRLADRDEQILALEREQAEAKARAEREKAHEERIVTERLSFDQLRSLAARLNIQVRDDMREREPLEAAITAALKAGATPAEVKPAEPPKPPSIPLSRAVASAPSPAPVKKETADEPRIDQ